MLHAAPLLLLHAALKCTTITPAVPTLLFLCCMLSTISRRIVWERPQYSTEYRMTRCESPMIYDSERVRKHKLLRQDSQHPLFVTNINCPVTYSNCSALALVWTRATLFIIDLPARLRYRAHTTGSRFFLPYARDIFRPGPLFVLPPCDLFRPRYLRVQFSCRLLDT